MSQVVSRLILLIFLLGLSATHSFADVQYAFTCDGSKINGSIKYSVIGRYSADFKECSGVITYDEVKKHVKSVRLEIKTKSIHSNCEWCDEVVVSKKLLDAERYPSIIFEGNNFKKDSKDSWVNGVIDLHGVVKDFNSKFDVQENGDGSLSAKGKWVLRRKDFNIVWSKILDHGGVLVGDHIAVDWDIRAKKI